MNIIKGITINVLAGLTAMLLIQYFIVKIAWFFNNSMIYGVKIPEVTSAILLAMVFILLAIIKLISVFL